MSEPHRPKLHFTPAKGWMNDPNGLIRIDGLWHMFFQHHPNGINHADMHWGHAVSRDLITWEERPVALAPDVLGTCFSGSAIETADGAVKMFYTAHSLTPDGRDHQVQCLVHANRDLTKAERDRGNPILPNPGLDAFRDPKVIWHAPTNRWIMLVTRGKEIGFYSSFDLQDWAFESSFKSCPSTAATGVWECPDLVPFDDKEGGQIWVLIIGVQSGAAHGGSGTMYFPGTFDGHVFTAFDDGAAEGPIPQWLDHGRDFYAAQVFFDRQGGTPTAIAWANNWDYARQSPTRQFRGAMSLPRVMSLVNTVHGYRILQKPPQSAAQSFEKYSTTSGTYALSRAFDLEIGEAVGLCLFGEARPQLILSRRSETTGHLRSIRRPHTDLPQFAHDYDVEVPWPAQGPQAFDLFVDRGLVECMIGGGAVWLTTLYYPQTPGGPVRILPLGRSLSCEKECANG